MAIFKALTFDGVNSLDYGIYITGEAVYNAPERAVEMVNIPGKNGALALDQGRFENIEITYHAGCFADSQADFADKVMKFRNALASRYTYKRLTDEYHPDEYRLGLYKSGLEVDAVRYGTAGEFNIVFDCKPQRFLVDGDRAISPTEWSDLQTESGELVTIESDGSLAVKSLEVSLSPIQSLNGYDKPWVGGAGKNKLPYPYFNTSSENNGITRTVNSDGSVTFSGTATGNSYFNFATENAPIEFSAGNYVVSVNGGESNPLRSGVSLTTNLHVGSTNLFSVQLNATTQSAAFTPSQDGILRCYVTISSGTTVNATIKPMIRLASVSDASYEPYENICPISGRTSVDTIVSPTTSASDGRTYTTALGRTVYGGTIDVVSGVLTVDRASVTLGNVGNINTSGTGTGKYVSWNSGMTLKGNGTIICDRMKGTTFSQRGNAYECYQGNADSEYIQSFVPSDATVQSVNDAISGATAVVTLATPLTYQLTPRQIDLLLGENHLFSDGEIKVTYGVHPYYNPTPFDAKPLIKVTGTGTLGIGEYILTITGTASQTLYIDCETMEIYTLEGTVPMGASSLVSINKLDFPVLKPGMNNISVGSGITAVTITPRWWRI